MRETCTMFARPNPAAAFPSPSSHGLRGDYAAAAADWTVPQAWDGYTPAEHARWRRLYARQAEVTAAHASPTFLRALHGLDASAGIPRLDTDPDLAGKRPNIPLDELTGGRAGKLLAVIDHWIEDIRMHGAEPETADETQDQSNGGLR